LLVIAVLVIAVLVFKDAIWKYFKVYRTYSVIPSTKNKLPVLGSILDLPLAPHEFTKAVVGIYETHRNEDVFCLWLGTHPLVVFFHPVGLENFFTGAKNITKSSDYDYLHPWLRTGLLTSAGMKWKNRRRILTPAFHDRELLDHFLDIYNEQSAILVKRLETLEEKKERDLYPLIAACALDIICEAAMGISIGAQQEKNSTYVDAVLKLTDIILKRLRMPWLWPKPLFDLLPDGREHSRCLNIVHQFTRKVINDRARAFQADEIHGKRPVFLDSLLKQMHDEQLTLDDIQEEVDTFMFEGHDTTAASMNFTCFLIASNPDVQAKVHAELDRVFGNDSARPCSKQDLDELEYLECVIKESLRLLPSVPFIAREVQQDFTYRNYQLLKGTTAVIFLYFIHRDPEQFPNPDQFDPDRFLPENSQNRLPYAYVPFSAGSRNCIGQRFALLEEKIVLSSILRRFRLKTRQTIDDLHLSFEVILRANCGALIELEKR